MEKRNINNDVLEYDDATHTYYVNGVIVPSVTQIVKFAYPNTYKDIEPRVLERARQLGVKMHKDIEDYEKGLQVEHSEELDSYVKLKSFIKWEVKHSEIPIIIYDKEKPLCAGRIDQIINIADEWYVNDLKRTKDVHFKNLTLQLSLYAIGYEQCYGKSIRGGYCSHLKKDVGEFISIKLDKKKAIEKCLEYVKQIDDGDEFEW